MTPAPDRLAITGIGVVSPYGVGRERFWDGIRHGHSATRAIEAFDASSFACRVAAPLPRISLDDAPAVDGDDADTLRVASIRAGTALPLSDRADPRRYSRTALAAVIAAREAWADAGLQLGEPGAGVIVGTGSGGIDIGEEQYREFFADGWKRITPYAIPVSICGMVSSEVSIALRLHGISHVLSCGCTSSTDAIGYAMQTLRAGDADVVLTGGADACVTPGMIFGFSRMKVVATRFNDRPAEASRPFDRARDGFVLGEGAWMLTLERASRARARQARIYAYIDGYGSTCDAYHRVQMDPDGHQIVEAMSLAIARAGIRREAIGYVNFHGYVDATQRRGRGALRQAGVRPTRRSPRGLVDQVDDRTPAGRLGRRRRRRRGARSRARVPASDGQSHQPGSGLRPRLPADRRARRVGRGGPVQLPRLRVEELRARARGCVTACSTS